MLLINPNNWLVRPCVDDQGFEILKIKLCILKGFTNTMMNYYLSKIDFFLIRSRFGAASCLAFNQPLSSDQGGEGGLLPTRLLVGYAKGFVVEFDLTTGKVLRSMEEAHPLGMATLCNFSAISVPELFMGSERRFLITSYTPSVC